jgi:colanic acid/amylovoran biosynthesis glycosyltransferase
MRVAVIASMKRGLEQFVYRELLFFTAQGISITLLPTKYQPGLYNAKADWEVLRWQPVHVVVSQGYFLLRAPRQYITLLLEALSMRALVEFSLAWYWSKEMAKADVLYATFGDRKLFIGYFGSKIVGRPLVVTIHAYELYNNPNARLFRRALCAVDQIVTVTEYNRQLLTNCYAIDSSKIQVVRCSVDTEEYQPARKFSILIVGFFVERKGHDVLFRAVRQLDKPDIEVWVVGGEGAEPAVDVRGLAVEAGVESQVAFFGKLSGNALRALYQACDVFCLPCHKDRYGVSEGFPNVLIEAMACGKPVITTRHVEIPRVIDRVLVDENDVNGLAEAIEQLYQAESMRSELGEQNRRTAERLFSLKNAERTAAILASLAGAQTASRGPGTGRGATSADGPGRGGALVRGG